MTPPTFREVTDLLGLPLAELAGRLEVSVQGVKQARLDPSSDGYRTPPPGWESKLAEIARERGGELLELAVALESVGDES